MKIKIIISAILTLASPLLLFAETQQATKVYEVEIDGQSFDVPGAKGRTVTLSNGQSMQIRVLEKQIQSYQTDMLRFDYDIGFTLEDDFTKQERTILMIHPTGCVVVITEYGFAEAYDEAQLLSNLASGLEMRARRGVVNDFKKEKARLVRFSHSKGRSLTFNYLDEDNDRVVYRVHVLQSERRIFSVIVFYDRKDEQDSEGLANIVLRSIRAIS